VVTGDVTQVDLPGGVKSGLRVVEGILNEVDDVSFQRLTAHDVVRHKLVGAIVAAYDEFDARQPRVTLHDSSSRASSVRAPGSAGDDAR
jgi:phosphate starvation-inducible PhoH-like protein